MSYNLPKIIVFFIILNIYSHLTFSKEIEVFDSDSICTSIDLKLIESDGEQLIKNVSEVFSQLGIDTDHRSSGIDLSLYKLDSCLYNIDLFLNNEIDSLKSQKKQGDQSAKQPLSLLKKIRKFITYSKNLSKTQGQSHHSFLQKMMTFTTLNRIIYEFIQAYAKYYDFQLKPQSLSKKIDKKLNIAKNFFFPGSISNFSVKDKSHLVLLSLEQAENESRFLVQKENKNNFVTPEEMTSMTSLEVSQLDIVDNHPMWHSNALTPKDRWQELEDLMNRSVRKKKKNKGYDLKKARRALFLKSLKASATSPKVNVKDMWGQKWKLKWGDEVPVEPVTNRLYLALGGKYADLVYANNKNNENYTVLFLPKKKSKEVDHLGCDLTHLSGFHHCLLNISSYNFNIYPFVEEYGELPQNIDDIKLFFKKHNLSLPKKYDLSQLENQPYVIFNESLVEFKGAIKIMTRGFAPPYSSLGSKEDRVTRGLYLFNVWISNRDAKDDNNRAILLKENGKINYYETQHDLGASLGQFVSGSIEDLKIGDSFLDQDENKFSLKEGFLYFPKAWEVKTEPDLRWMAQKMAKISNHQINEIVKYSGWPDFMQIALAHRLQSRRNTILKAFGYKGEPLDLKNPFTIEYEVKISKVSSDEFNSQVYFEQKAVSTESVDEVRFTGKNLRKLLKKYGLSDLNLATHLIASDLAFGDFIKDSVTEKVVAIENFRFKTSSLYTDYDSPTCYNDDDSFNHDPRNGCGYIPYYTFNEVLLKTQKNQEGQLQPCHLSFLIGALEEAHHPSGLNPRVSRAKDFLSIEERRCIYTPDGKTSYTGSPEGEIGVKSLRIPWFIGVEENTPFMEGH